ncbi:hypothetical protein QQ045_004402 [Rhodiola kirilowii]
MTKLTFATEDSRPSLLELAANNDVDGFKKTMERDVSLLNRAAPWYGRRKKGSKLVLEDATPLMVAATYGSLDVLKILIHFKANVNMTSGPNKTTALHCAASSGVANALEVVETLLIAGANPKIFDNNGDFPIDVIVVPPKQPGMRASLERLLMTNTLIDHFSGERNPGLSTNTSNLSSPVLSSSPENGSPLSLSDSTSSPMTQKASDLPAIATEKKEYPIDPSLPDIKNSIYSTDEFRMFSFKIRPCSRAYSHDWTECPFVHPGENARRRDPRKYHYSCEPCPDFHKGACRRGDLCEYAHGVFECWLHPAQYRTRLCKDGTTCARRVCFFAHVPEELRPLYVSTGSAVPSPSPRTAALNLLPGSPSSLSGLSSSPFGQPMSPSTNGMPHSSSVGWPQQNGPTLQLPGNSFQSSRLRASLNARDLPAMDLNMLVECDVQRRLLDEMNYYSPSRIKFESFSQSNHSNTLTPSNLENLLSAEVSSPRYSDQAAFGGYSPSHKQNLISQFHQQQQRMLSPINTSMYSPKNAEHSFLQASFGVGSPGRMSPRNLEQLSPVGTRPSVFAQRGDQNQQLRSISSRELGSGKIPFSTGSPGNPWSDLGYSNGKVDWSVQGDEMLKLKRPSTFQLNNNGEEPDLSWVQSLVTESPPGMKEKLTPSISGTAAVSGEGSNPNTQIDSTDQSVLGAWLEQMQLDQRVG